MGADPQASVKATMVSEIGLGLKVSASTAMLHLSVVERDVASARIGVGGGANATVADIKMADDIESWMQFFLWCFRHPLQAPVAVSVAHTRYATSHTLSYHGSLAY